jgi:HD-like signal output (HDOD) protein/CheY-like chemotaxis protein
MKKSLLLVDDEPLVLSGLQRSLRSMRDEWAIEFAGSGDEALEVMAKHTFDVILTDMRMPGMDGAQLLNEVRKRSPQTVRMALSGQCDRDTIMSAVGATHQYISKPCDAQQLKDTINHAVAMRGQLERASLTQVVSRLKSIPSLPASYQAMMAELGELEPRLVKLAELISRDMGMTAKCLQLVNSAFFGLRTPVSSAHQAISLIGLDRLKSLILSNHIFSEFKTGIFDAKEVGWLWEHSFAVSVSARKVAVALHAPPKDTEDAVAAGLLHDTGKLVLAACMGAEYKIVLDMVDKVGVSLVEAEREVIGADHGEVGAYLLGIWGLPDAIVEAVGWSQRPCAAPPGASIALTAVHIACAAHSLTSPSRLSGCIQVDSEYMRCQGLEVQGQMLIDACRSSNVVNRP